MMARASLRNKVWEFAQSLGKTFMFPVSLMAFMGLLLGVGSSITSPSTIDNFPFPGIQIISATLMDEWREVANC